MIAKLQFISNESDTYTHLQSIAIALDGGCTWIQLRVKNKPVSEVLGIAYQAKELCHQYKAKLIINDFSKIASEIQAYGLHLGLNDQPISEARTENDKNMIIGGTANSVNDIHKRIFEKADYIGLGPLRFTKTKNKLSPILGFEGYQQILSNPTIKHLHPPIVAIGGVTVDDISQLIDSGVYGIAVSNEIITASNPTKIITKIHQALC